MRGGRCRLSPGACLLPGFLGGRHHRHRPRWPYQGHPQWAMGQVPPRAPHQRHRRRYRYRGRCREDQRYVDREVLMRKRAFTGFVLGTVLGAFGLCLGIIAHDTLTPTVLADVVCAQTQGCSILNPIFTGTAAMARGTFSGLLTSDGGPSPSCAMGAGSTDSVGAVVLTTGTGAPGAAGSFPLTFNAALGANNGACVFMPFDGAAAWNGRATFKGTSATTGANVIAWDNNAVALTISTTYGATYHCFGK